ncbi:glycosyltransferase [Acetobacteraceae bacterium KSS8]|uniref:Glycosyltransferase n=1 Tax=Endosaccharibacter trunci TaxID=2812733 RepID=A0ABT1W8I3_9PROT|nr:glycosyltransferase [Acetobacteraceae bacterium KSS8]
MDDSRQGTEEQAGRTASPSRVPLWRVFDPVWYLSRHPDAAAHMERLGMTDVQAYYLQYGGGLGHSPNVFFDENYYLALYPDVAAHVAAGGAPSGFAHYITHGYRSRSPHWLFDEERYRRIYPDLGDPSEPTPGFVNGYDHFLAHGDEEGRSAHRFFDKALYDANVDESPELAAQPGGPFRHFLRSGGAAGSTARLSWYFDPDWYLRTYPEVAEEVRNGVWSSALHHYLVNRLPWRYSPNPWFSEEFYTATYADALREIRDGRFRNGYDHFLRFGALEGRRPHQDVDLARYLEDPKVRASLKAVEFHDGFAHWVANRTRNPAVSMSEFDAEQHNKDAFCRMAEKRVAQFARSVLDFTVEGTPAVSVIMVIHDRFALTMTALASLRANFHGPIELILVDSGSTDRTRQLDRVVIGAKWLRFEENVGFLLGCNAAFSHVTARAVLFLNNDVVLGHEAVARASARLFSRRGVGAVGAKVIRTNGLLQEAGCIVWRNGATSGFMRDGDPDAPEANTVRDVDFCSGAFLMVRADCLSRLGGFDTAYAPAYYEETDLCVRLHKAGYRVLYDPNVVIEHLEYGTSGALQSEELIARNHKIFVEKHADWLGNKLDHSDAAAFFASRPGVSSGRILFIEDQVPLRTIGAGFVRSNDLVHGMSALGYEVTVFPLFPADLSLFEVMRAFPDNVEVLFDRGLEELPRFLQQRAGFYDLVWVGRTHNLHRLRAAFDDAGAAFPQRGLILDTEAVAAPRTLEQARVLRQPSAETLPELLRKELEPARSCQRVIAVNEIDAELIRQTGISNVATLGHVQTPRPTGRSWRERSGLFFLGALHDVATPNYDSLVWFVSEVLPLLQPQLPADARVTVAGHVAPGLDLSPLQHPLVDLVGPIDDSMPFYDRHRVFIAPTRFAGGIPFKLHEAAARGLPVVATALLCRQVGWVDGEEILSGGSDDAALFARQILALHTDETLWYRLRDAALRRIRLEHDPAEYQATLSGVLDGAMRHLRRSS